MNATLSASLKLGTLLVAEDSCSAQMYLKNLFKKINLTFKIFEDGMHLLNYVEETPDLTQVPLIITDIEMPIISGHEVIRRLKSIGETKHIPILVLSSMTNEQSRKAVWESGADGFVGKGSVEQMMKQLIATVRIPLASSIN